TVSCLVHDGAYVYDSKYTNEIQSEEVADEKRDVVGGFKVIQEFLKPISRREAYLSDIVYGTNHEFGFDYLRDNLAYNSKNQVQREHYFAIIDEVDSILIDEARTPLIISAPDVEAAQYYKVFAKVVSSLEIEKDYTVEEKDRSAVMTDDGIAKVEKMLNIENIYDAQSASLVHYLEESLKAKALFRRDRHYVVKSTPSGEGEIIIVDEFTGRLMHGRRYSGGLHQAIEAKEGVRIQEESKTFAQITIQNYFRLYEKISGMTGTAKTSAEEFRKVYGLEVAVIPSNKPRVRNDKSDLIFKTKESKYQAIVGAIKEMVEKGQPVLVGTTSIDENELLSSYFSNAGIKHEVLNAKNHEREGEIIAQAGRSEGVTLATNMAGRGVDIVLGGNPQDVLDAQKVKDAGGLFVLGTQRNEARRVDNQLRGRSGRQGDPGETQFFLSLEDDMLRIFGGDRIKSMMNRMNMPDDVPIESSLIGKVVDEAQKKVEGMNFDIRKHLLEYDDVLNKQRKAVYRKRQNILERLEKGELEDVLKELILDVLKFIFSNPTKDLDSIKQWFEEVGLVSKEEKDSFNVEQVESSINQGVLDEFILSKINNVCQDPQVGLKILGSLDGFWTNHLENLEALLESVRMRAYGQKDPLVEYKREGHQLFKDLIINAQVWVVSNVFKEIQINPNKNVSQKSLDTIYDIRNTDSKLGRNDPCYCGSGKKYKKCHGK
ncbi:MAG: SEC-C metal-binding domain-containing protein, partial [Candidatus Paceibacterota bacterium]